MSTPRSSSSSSRRDAARLVEFSPSVSRVAYVEPAQPRGVAPSAPSHTSTGRPQASPEATDETTGNAPEGRLSNVHGVPSPSQRRSPKPPTLPGARSADVDDNRRSSHRRAGPRPRAFKSNLGRSFQWLTENWDVDGVPPSSSQVFVDPTHLGKVIGRGGRMLKALQRYTGVLVTSAPPPDDSLHVFRLFGPPLQCQLFHNLVACIGRGFGQAVWHLLRP